MTSKRATAPLEQSSLGQLLGRIGILVLDSAPGGALGLKRNLVALGALPDQIEIAPGLDVAKQLMAGGSHQLIFAEEGRSRELPRPPNVRFVALSTGTSQAVASEVLRSGMDAFLIKPYHSAVLEAVLKRVFIEELDPPEYLLEIRKGEQALASGDPQKARDLFVRALSQSKRPALAHACLADLAVKSGKTDAAIESYWKALLESHVHYTSLIGLERLLRGRDQKDREYEIVRRLALYYPVDPARLAVALRLAIETRTFEDITRFLGIYHVLPERPPELTEHLCSALVTAGRHYLETNRDARAHESFRKSIEIRPESTRFLRRTVEILVLLGKPEEAGKYLEEFPAAARGSSDYLACQFLVSADLSNPAELIAGAEKLIEAGHRTPGLYEAVLKALVSLGDRDRAASFLEEASFLWPHREKDFEAAAFFPPKAA